MLHAPRSLLPRTECAATASSIAILQQFCGGKLDMQQHRLVGNALDRRRQIGQAMAARRMRGMHDPYLSFDARNVG